MEAPQVPSFWMSVARSSIVGLIVSTLLVAGVFLVFGNTGAEQVAADRQLAVVQAQARDANLSIACVIAIPLDPKTGTRAPADVDHCFEQYGLPVPDGIGSRSP